VTPKFTDEMALVSKIRSLGIECAAFDGLTTPDQRRQCIRAAIDPVLDVTFTILNGRRLTMAMKYADTYGEVP